MLNYFPSHRQYTIHQLQIFPLYKCNDLLHYCSKTFASTSILTSRIYIFVHSSVIYQTHTIYHKMYFQKWFKNKCYALFRILLLLKLTNCIIYKHSHHPINIQTLAFVIQECAVQFLQTENKMAYNF